MNKIAQELRSEGIPTKQGGKWWASTISQILGNSLYTNETSYGGIETDGQQKPIVSKRLFHKVQKKRRETGRRWKQLNTCP